MPGPRAFNKIKFILSTELPGCWAPGLGKTEHGSNGKNQSGSSLVKPLLFLRKSLFWQTSEPKLGK